MDIDQFGEIKNDEDNRSIVSDVEEHGMSQFGDMPDNNNQSIISEKQHGMSEFQDINQNQNNQSTISNQEEIS